MIPLNIPSCRVCNQTPAIIRDADIAPPSVAWAIACRNTDCNNDTHWQLSLTEAVRLWQSNPCRGMLGGGGDAADDERITRQ